MGRLVDEFMSDYTKCIQSRTVRCASSVTRHPIRLAAVVRKFVKCSFLALF